MSGGDWIAIVPRPTAGATAEVERHPALAAADAKGRWAPLTAPRTVAALGETFRLDLLPYLLVREGDHVLGAVSLALHGDDLALLGLADQPALGSPHAVAAWLDAAVDVGREIGRRRIVAPVTNADPQALFYLQAAGFTLTGVTAIGGPPRTGLAGIAATHEFVLERPIA